jgi:hypothetical protein
MCRSPLIWLPFVALVLSPGWNAAADDKPEKIVPGKAIVPE